MTSSGAGPLIEEAAEEPQRLDDGQLVGELRLLQLDAEPLAQRRASAAQRSPSTSTSPESGSVRPSQISIVVVLPAPFGPSRPKHSPGRHVEVDAVDGDDVLVGLAQIGDAQGGARLGQGHPDSLTRGPLFKSFSPRSTRRTRRPF